MKTITSIKEMQHLSNQLRLEGKRIGLVPTMGFLHEGHLSLVREIKKQCDVTAMSIFVNPTQFGPNEDFQDYPRDFERDKKLAEQVGCDIIFCPSAEELYSGNYLTYVAVEKISSILCGVSRPIHFRGVTTIVVKLFNIVKPQVAIFGQKDAQQVIIIKKMVSDLNFDIEIIVAPIVRESDGLAKSSRNTYLSPDMRQQATVLYQSLKAAEQKILAGETKADEIVALIKNKIIEKPDAQIDYVEIVDPETLEFQFDIQSSVLIALAVNFGKTRLIDNIIVHKK
jgi:pantoate--beta-alanine ligase